MELGLKGLHIRGCIPETFSRIVDLFGPTCVGMEALIALYHATDGPNWKNNDNWLSDKFIGEWYGVVTDEQGRVIKLALGENKMKGQHPGLAGCSHQSDRAGHAGELAEG